MTDIGHNAGVDAQKLGEIFERIRVQEEYKRKCVEDIKELYQEAKSLGFDVPALRDTVKAYFIAQDQAKKRKLADRNEVAAVYANALQIELPF